MVQHCTAKTSKTQARIDLHRCLSSTTQPQGIQFDQSTFTRLIGITCHRSRNQKQIQNQNTEKRNREAIAKRKQHLGYEPIPYDDHKDYGFETEPLRFTTKHHPNMLIHKRTGGSSIATSVGHDEEIYGSEHESAEGDNIDDMTVCSICNQYICDIGSGQICINSEELGCCVPITAKSCCPHRGMAVKHLDDPVAQASLHKAKHEQHRGKEHGSGQQKAAGPFFGNAYQKAYHGTHGKIYHKRKKQMMTNGTN